MVADEGRRRIQIGRW
nr:hypothetical protein [Tanacetum cinerariifolium]